MVTHGLTKSVEYRTWRSMKERCYNPNNKKYKDYGGRGIKVCDRWLNNFENFHADMGPRPSKEYSLDRIDNNGDYMPTNCKWATIIEQRRNQRPKVSNSDLREAFMEGFKLGYELRGVHNEN